MKYTSYTIGDFKKLYEMEKGCKAPEYIPILHDVFIEIHKLIIRETQFFSFPHRCGELSIVTIGNKAAVDNGHYQKTGEIKKLTNLHSNRAIYRFNWRPKEKERFLNSKFYKFVTPLDAKDREIGRRGLAKWIKECAADPKRKDFVPYR